MPRLVEKLADGDNIKITGNSKGNRVGTVIKKIVEKADDVTKAVEQESKTPASRVLKQCKEYERKNRRYFITVQISPSTKLLIDKRKHKNIDIKELKKKYGVL